MAKIDREKVRTWYRMDGALASAYVMSVDDLITDPDELRAAIDAEMRISITVGFGSKGETSLAFLEPVIADVQDLRIGTVNRITDVEVLNGARGLRSLAFATGPCDGRLNLAALPHLQEFVGPITRVVGSVMQNPSLRFLQVEGAIPKSFLNVAGWIEIFEQTGGRSQTELPVFAHPESMVRLRRVGAAEFDLAQLSGMSDVRELIVVPDRLSGLKELPKLPNLTKLTLYGAIEGESWEDLPMVPWARLEDISPMPSQEFLDSRRAMGWWVPAAPSGEALTLDVAGDEDDEDGSWGVFMSRFDDLAEAVELLDDFVPGGLYGEHFILGVVAEQRNQGAVLDAVPDSEGSFTAVYFPNRAQAEQVYLRAKELLAADPETQLRYLRAGAS